MLDLTSEITFAVLTEMKHALGNSKIVLWVNNISTELAFQAMGLGVRGILRRTLPTDLQVKCLQKVQAGELWFEKALTDSFLCARRVALTQRECGESLVARLTSPIRLPGSCCNTNAPAGSSAPRAGAGLAGPIAARRPRESQASCGVAGQGAEARARSRPAKAPRARAIPRPHAEEGHALLFRAFLHHQRVNRAGSEPARISGEGVR